MPLLWRIIVILLGLCVFTASEAYAEQRLALIITNQDYPASVGRLGNTHHDGDLVAEALRHVGFDVEIVRDADKTAMLAAVSYYVRRLDQAGPDTVGFFYYSGHGAAMKAHGENFLIPVGSPLNTSVQLPLLGVKLSDIIESLSLPKTRANFVVVDACRNVFIARNTKSFFKGIAPERERGGMLIAFATEPGSIAVDENIFAKALATEIKDTDKPAVLMFRAVRRRVLKETNQNQFPWTRDGLVNEFYFGRPDGTSRSAKEGPNYETKLAARPSDKEPVNAYDGLWQVERRGTGCKVNSGAFIIVVTQGKVTSVNENIPNKIGQVSADGAFTFKALHPHLPEQYMEFIGSVRGKIGSGSFKGSRRGCEGFFTITQMTPQ